MSGCRAEGSDHPDLERAMDVFTDVLETLHLNSRLCSRTDIPAPWRFHFTASRDAVLHVFNFGGGYLCLEGEPNPLPVADGDVIMLPHGQAHAICDDLTSPLTKSVQLDYHSPEEYQVFPFDGEGPRTVLLCGIMQLENAGDYPLVGFLPQVIQMKGEQGRMGDGIADTLRLLVRESGSTRTGAEAMLRRLTELLFIQVVRAWVESQSQATDGWLFALRDPQIGTALSLIHHSLDRRWTVAALAHAVALSRSAFSSRFTMLVGEPPMQYLTRWRMHTATRLLRNGVEMVNIARQVGYESEAAFRKAFKREVGMAPGKYRHDNGVGQAIHVWV